MMRMSGLMSTKGMEKSLMVLKRKNVGDTFCTLDVQLVQSDINRGANSSSMWAAERSVRALLK